MARALIAAATVALLGAVGGPAAAQSGGTVVVGYQSAAALRAALQHFPAREVRTVPALRTAELRVSGDVPGFARALGRQPGILYVHRPAARFSAAEPALAADSGGAYEWQYGATRANAVPPSVLAAASQVTIAVIDTGADLTAPDLAAKGATGYRVDTGSPEVEDTNGHGTFVAALAAGSTGNAEGIAGFGGDARLLVVQAGDPSGDFTDVEEAAAIVYAVDHGARIINLSLGGPQTSATERRAIEYAVAHGVLLVAAAGNDAQNGNPVEYPAGLLQPVGSRGEGGYGLSIAASDQSGARAPFSSTGSWISLAAPGVNVFSDLSASFEDSLFTRVTLPGSRAGVYGIASGTSFAAPEVAGAAALVWAANPLLTAQQVAGILKQTASGRGAWAEELGYGVLDVAAAVARASRSSESTGRVTLRGRRLPDGTITLSWDGSGAASFRVSVRQDDGKPRVLVPSTADRSAKFDLTFGHTYSFTVSGLDATGTPVAQSQPLGIALPRAKAALRLSVSRFGGLHPLKVQLSATLAPHSLGVAASGRDVVLEAFAHGSWHPSADTVTGPGGRAAWTFTLGPGVYRLRARFVGTADLAAATSAPVAVVVR
jgi:subtilisin family serine protease